MKIGSVEGIVSDALQVVYDSGELAGTATSISIAVAGDTNQDYILLSRGINAINGTGYTVLRLNNDSGNNYSSRYFNAASTTVSTGNTAPSTFIGVPTYGSALNDNSWSKIDIHIKSGHYSASVSQLGHGIATVFGNCQMRAECWAVTNAVTTIDIVGSAANAIGIGSRFILLQRQNTTGMDAGNVEVQGTVDGALQLIHESTIPSEVATYTISSLNGNSDVVYYFEATCVDSDIVGAWTLLINNDTSANNCIYQYLYYSGSAISGNQASSAGMFISSTSTDSNVGFTNGWIYAKSGYKRPAMFLESRNCVDDSVGDLVFWHFAWKDTSTNITSLVISCQTDEMQVLSNFKLYRINL